MNCFCQTLLVRCLTGPEHASEVLPGDFCSSFAFTKFIYQPTSFLPHVVAIVEEEKLGWRQGYKSTKSSYKIVTFSLCAFVKHDILFSQISHSILVILMLLEIAVILFQIK